MCNLDLLDLTRTLAATVALDTEIVAASTELKACLDTFSFVYDFDIRTPDALNAADLHNDNDLLLEGLADLIAERDAQTCEVHMNKCDAEIAITLHRLSELHRVPLALHITDWSDYADEIPF